MGTPNPLPRAWRILILICLSLVVGLSGITAARKRAPESAPTPAPAAASTPAPAPAPGPTPKSSPAPNPVPAKPAAAEPAAPTPTPTPAPSPAPQQASAATQDSPTSAQLAAAQQRADLVRRRAEWFQRQRAYPFKHVPAGALQNAIEQRDRMVQQQRSGVRFAAPGVISFPGDGIWHLAGPQPTNNLFGTNTGNILGGNGGSPTASGRVTSLAVDTTDATGQTIYLGSAAGGVWKTTNGGAASNVVQWTPLTDNQPSLAVGSIAIDPNSCSPAPCKTIYVGTGEENFNNDGFYGAGILKSINGGTTWTQQGAANFAGAQFSDVGGARIGAIAVQPGNSSIVLAAVTFIDNGTMGGIYRSADGGANWAQVSAGPVGAAGTDVVFEPTSVAGATAIVYAAMGDPFGDTPNGIYRSTDSGQTWTKQSGGLPTSNVGRIKLGYAPSTSGGGATIYAAIADSSTSSSNLLGFFKTINAGTAWTQLTNTPAFCNSQCFFDVAVTVHPTNANFVVVGGGAFTNNSSTLFKSTDGGTTWSNSTTTDFTIGSTSVRPHVDTHAIAFAPNGVTPRLYTGDDGGMYRTDDPTPVHPAWVDLNATLATSQFYPGVTASVSDENYGFGGTQDNNIQVFSGTLDWNEVSTCGDGGFTAVDQSFPTTIYVGCNVTAQFKVQKSVFNGLVFAGPTDTFNGAETEISGSGDRMEFIPPLAIDVKNPTTLYFGTCRIYQTTTGAEIVNGVPAWTAITGDLSATNTPGACGNSSSESITTISLSDQSSAIAFAGTSNGKVWNTQDATLGLASTWTGLTKAPLPGRHITAVRTKPGDATGNIAYVTFSGFGSCLNCGTTPGHVFKTVNATAGAGVTWKDISGNLPDAPVNDIIVDHSGSPTFDALYIATDVGVFSCPDPEAATPCTNWTVIGDPMPNSPVLALAMRPESRILRAATHGRSMWYTQLTDQQIPPDPLLSSMTPAAVMAGSATTTVNVMGANFSSNTLVLFNGFTTGVNTTFVNTTQLTVTFDTSLLTDGGVFTITLTDPLGNAQNSLPFTVMNPVPHITGGSTDLPNGLVGEPVTFTLTGTGFVSSTELTFTSSGFTVPIGTGTPSGGGTSLVVNVPGQALTTPGTVTVSVLNSLPGGGPSSSSFSFTIIANSGPEAVFTPPAISFFSPGQDAGTTSAVMNVKLSNAGTTTLNLTLPAPNFTGANPGDFLVVPPNGQSPPCVFTGAGTVAVGNFCWFGVTFSPPGGTAPGFRSATLVVNDNDTDIATHKPENVSVLGLVNGPVPLFQTSIGNFCTGAGCFPTPVSFGSVPKGTPSETDGTLSNVGSGTPALGVSGISILTSTNSADFALGAPTSGTACVATPFNLNSPPTLPFSCVLGITFTPSTAGLETATLEFTFSNSATAKIDVPLTGIGVVPTITTISPSIVSTGGPTFTMTVTGTNYVLGSVVNFSRTLPPVPADARLTTFVSATQLQASITASDIAAAGSSAITVTNPSGGGTSEPKTLIIAEAPTGTNDNFANATVTTATYRTTEETTLFTTNTGGTTDPTPACGGGSRAKSAWFKFVAPATGRVVADTRFSGYSTILSVWTAALASITCGSTAPESLVTFNVTNGTTYYLMVTDANTSGTGGVLTFRLEFATGAPPNDNFVNATVITPPAAGSVYNNSVGTILATVEVNDPTPSCAGGALNSGRNNTVWYSFTPGSTTPVTADTLGGQYDTILTVVTGSPGAFTEVACNDNAGTGASQVLQSQVSFTATGGTPYFFMVSSVLGDGGFTRFHLSLTAAATGTATLTLLPNPVNFATTAVGNASVPQAVTLKNTGPGSVTITNITLTAGDVNDFIGTPQVGDCSDGGNGVPPTVLAVGQSCIIHGDFTPTATTPNPLRSATLAVTASGAVNSPSTTLQGTATAAVGGTAALSLNVSTLNFPDQAVGTTSTTVLTAVLSNAGPGSAAIAKLKGGGANQGDFAQATPVVGTDCAQGMVLTASGPNHSCNTRVTFTPSAPGARSVTETITATNAPTTSPLVLTANGNGASPTTIATSSGTPQGVAINTAFAPLVALVKDGAGNPIEGVVVTFTAPGSGASGTFAGGVNTATTDGNGLATAPTFTANSITGGPYNVAATAGAVGPANFSLTNTAGAAATITATGGTPQSTTISTAFGSTLQATVKDAGSNPVSGVVVTFTAPAQTGASVTFAGGVNTATTNASGVATSAAITANSHVGGPYNVAATAGAVGPANFSLTNTAGAAATITATGGTPQSTTIGTAFGSTLQATVKDAGSNPVSGVVVTFTAPAQTGASVTFAGGVNTATTNASGVATSAAITANSHAGGPYNVAATAGAVGPANFSLTNTAGAAATITATAGTPQSTTISTAFGSTLQATVTDAGSNPVSGVVVTFAAPAQTGASVTFAGGVNTATTNASGVATSAVFTANSHAGGPYNVAATAGAVGPANFSLTNTAGAAATITATGGTPQSAAINAAFGSTLQTTVKDAGSNPVSGVVVTFTAPAQTGASVTFAGGVNTATTNASGVATSVVFTANSHAGGPYTVAATAGAVGPANFSLTNTAGAAATITATGGTPQSAAISTAFGSTLQATVTDAGSNPVSGVVVTFTAPVQTGASVTFAGGVNTATTNASGVATSAAITANSHAGGPYNVAATAGAVGPANFSLTNTAGAAATITATGGTPQSTTISTAFGSTLQATVKDAGNNPLAGVIVTFAAPAQTGASVTFAGGVNTATTNASGVATSAAITANSHVGGPYNVAATAGAAGPANFSLTNTAGAAATITATGGTPQSGAINTAFGSTLQATVKDAGSNPVSGVVVTFAAPAQTGASVTFAGGVNTATTNASGVATSAAITANSHVGGPYNVAATAGAVGPANFSLTNTAGAAATITATGGTPQSTTISTAFGSTLQATVTDAGSNPVSGVVVTFTAPAQTGASVTFAGGVNTATTNASGVATSAAITANSHAGGPYTVTAAVGGVGAPANFSLTNTAGASATITATGGTPQSAAINAAFGSTLQATVKDAGSNPVSGVVVTFTAPAQTGASVTFAGGVNTATTNASGVATSAAITANSHAGGPYTVTAAVGGVGAPANFSLTNTAGPAATITATAGTPQSTTISTAFASTLQATVKDAGSNPVSGVVVTFTAPAQTGASVTFAGGVNTATTNASGVATLAAITANSHAGGPYNVAATAGAVGPANFSLTNTAGPAATITATAGTPQSTTISTAFASTLQATVKDTGSNPVSGVVVTFTAPAQTGASGTFAGGVNTATTNASGVATSAVFTANSIAGGPYNVAASVSGVATPANFSLTNTSAPPTSIVVSGGTPQSAPINVAFGLPLQVTVKDAGNSPVSGAVVTFTAPAQTGTSGTFAGGVNTATTNASGVATSAVFTANSIAGGPYIVSATVVGVAAPANFLLTNTAGAPGSITASGGTPQNATVNAAFASQLQVTVKDAGSNPVSGVIVTFTAPAQTGASGTFAGGVNTATTNASGVATSVVFTANSVAGGPYNVAASVSGVATPANFALTNNAGPPATITATGGTPQSAIFSTAFATKLQATVTDASNNPISGATVTFTAPLQTGPSGTFAGGVNTATTNASGVATSAVFTANANIGGPYIVSAAVSGVAAPANFSLTNTAGPPASVTAVGGTPQSTTVNTTFASLLQVVVKDSGGNLVSGVIVTFAAPPQTGASGTFAGGVITATTNASGVATSAAITANSHAGGPYNVSATVAGVVAPANFALTNTPGPPASITATSGAPQSTTISTAFASTLQATVKDASNNPISGVIVTFTAPAQAGASGTFAGGVNTATTNASGVATSVVFTANSIAGGPYNISATVAGVVAPANFALTNTPGPPASITATSGTPQSTTISTAFASTLQATVKDASNNPISGVIVTFTAPAQAGASGTFAGGVNTATTNASGVATAPAFTANTTAGGPYTVTAKAGAIGPANFSLTNLVGPPSIIAATAGTPQNATIGAAFTTAMKATVTDAGNNPLQNVSVTFTAPGSGASGTFPGSVTSATVNTDASGVATAPAFTANTKAGAYTVTAKAGAVGPANFSLTNNPGPPASIATTAGTPQSAIVGTAFGTALKATVADSSGNPVPNTAVTFTAPASGASGTFPGSAASATVNTDPSGVATAPAFTANSTAGGPYTVTAKAGAIGPANYSLTNTDYSLNLVAPGTVQITAGTPSNVQLNLTTIPAGSALPADVNYTCAVPAALSGTTCTMNPAKTPAGTLGGSAAANTTLMITTNANLPPSPRRRDPWTPYLPWATATALAGLLAIFFAARQKIVPLAGRPAYLTLALLLITTAGIAGCTTAKVSTPKGASSVTVTSTSGGVSKTTTINITVN